MQISVTSTSSKRKQKVTITSRRRLSLKVSVIEVKSTESKKFDLRHETIKNRITTSTMATGCQHYKRACLVECPDYAHCGKESFWPCRMCHDKVKYDECLDHTMLHRFDRYKVQKVKCLRCDTV